MLTGGAVRPSVRLEATSRRRNDQWAHSPIIVAIRGDHAEQVRAGRRCAKSASRLWRCRVSASPAGGVKSPITVHAGADVAEVVRLSPCSGRGWKPGSLMLQRILRREVSRDDAAARRSKMKAGEATSRGGCRWGCVVPGCRHPLQGDSRSVQSFITVAPRFS